MDGRQVCVIVDAYSSGRYLAKELLTRGYAALHVQSTPEIPFRFLESFNPSDFISNIIYRGDLNSIVSEISHYDVVCVIVGTELGVEVADHLSESLNLPTNGSRLTKARRDKFEMMEALRARGIKTAEYTKSANVLLIVEWAREKGFFKIVLKPINSAGTDNVHVCETESDIHIAFNKIIGQENKLGFINKEVLAEEYLDGIEHVVNTVSRNGNHYIAEMWRCEKRQVKGRVAYARIYDVDKLLPFDGEVQKELIDYTRNVLDALEITHGPAHAEIMMTSKGPVLIEIGARLMGSVNPLAMDECLGTNLIRLTADAYLNPYSFIQKCETPYSIKKTAYDVSLISNIEGTVEAIPFLDKIKQLESFFSVKMNIQNGMRIERTVDLFTSPGLVHLVHSESNVLERDYSTVRQLEAIGYVLQSN